MLKYEVEHHTTQAVEKLLKRAMSKLPLSVAETLENMDLKLGKADTPEVPTSATEPISMQNEPETERQPTQADNLALRQIEAMERHTEALNRMADEMARRRESGDDYGGRVERAKTPATEGEMSELLDSIPFGLFKNVEWGS